MHRLFWILIPVLAGCAARSLPEQRVGTEPNAAMESKAMQHESARVAYPDEHYFKMIESCPKPGFCSDPVPLIRAVNAMVPLGKPETIRLLRAYLRAKSADRMGRAEYAGRVFWVARLLFVEPDGAPMRCPSVGCFGLVVREGASNWPCYPLAVVDGIPFEVTEGMGVSLNGRAEMPERYLDDIEKSAVLRQTLLRPADNPVDAAEALLKSDAWKDLVDEWDRENEESSAVIRSRAAAKVRAQAVNSLRHVYGSGASESRLLSWLGEGVWADWIARTEALWPYWDEHAQDYLVRG
ncbi:MAG: hypothetical protein H6839_10170 [Planctomycetes bacterium]|nr:hypothetical protein [Planctomycetota bacterium]